MGGFFISRDLTIGPFTLSGPEGNGKGWLAKVTPAGDVEWAINLGNSTSVRDIAIDDADNIYVVGTGGTVTIGTETYTGGSVFVVREGVCDVLSDQ